MIKVITYDATHRKTQDLLIRLKLRGYKNIQVIATPWQSRKNFKPLIPHRDLKPLELGPKEISNHFGYKFIPCESIIDGIEGRNNLILIGGAGIIPKEALEKCTIINSHPAYLPFVRGLDALKWAIYFNKPIGVTTHVISEEPDAGYLIKREFVPLYSWDTFHSFAHRQYEMEINFLVDSIEDIKNSPLEPLPTNKAELMRRMPHSKEIKLLKRFEALIDKLD